eukprot:2468568-Lingulodinium_polyedra.AAC.1
MVFCPAHLCKCGRRSDSGVECVWRHVFMHFRTSGPMANVMNKKRGTVAYLQVLEMHGKQGLPQPRQRVLINLIAARPETYPLNETLM